MNVVLLFEAPPEMQIAALNKLKDCERTSEAQLILTIAKLLQDDDVRNSQLGRIVNTFFKIGNKTVFREGIDCRYVELSVEATRLKFGDSFQRQVSKELNWDSLAKYTEPYLKDRNYQIWSDAKRIVQWDLQFLCVCQKLYGELDGKLKIYHERAMSLPEEEEYLCQ